MVDWILDGLVLDVRLVRMRFVLPFCDFWALFVGESFRLELRLGLVGEELTWVVELGFDWVEC